MMHQMEMLRRFQITRSGYDCIHNPCGEGRCGIDPGGSHGIHNDEWVFAAADDEFGTSLTVWTGVFPSSVDTSKLTGTSLMSRRGMFFHEHATFLTGRRAVLDAVEPEECPFLGKCFSADASTIEYAEKFFASFVEGLPENLDPSGAPPPNMPEKFWERMIGEWVERARAAKEDRTDEWRRCPTCHGDGTVPAKLLIFGSNESSSREADRKDDAR